MTITFPKVSLAWYLLIAACLYILFLKSCGTKCPVAGPVEVVKRDTLIIHETEHVPVYIPGETSVTPPDTQYLAMWIDTASIVNDYLSKRAYSDTIRNKYGFVVVIDTIYQNKIADRKVTFDFQVPQITLTTQIQPKNQIYGGIDIGASNYFSIGPQLLLRTKTDKLYWIGASFTSQNQFYYHGGAAWLIHF